MSKADVEAAQAYVAEHWPELWANYTPAQKLKYLGANHTDPEVRESIQKILRESELTAKIQMLAPWYEPGDERSEARFAAMVARKYGLTWWRDTTSINALLGAMDEVWHSQFVEPHLIAMEAIPEDVPPYLGVRFDGFTITRDGYTPAQPIEITSPQQFKILKFIYDAAEKGRTKGEMDAAGFTSLKQEKTKINDQLIPLDLRFLKGEHKLINKPINGG